MTNVDNSVREIAKAVAQEIKRSQSLVVTAADVAAMVGYAVNSQPVREILKDPTFPPSVPLVEGGNRRYLRRDVEAWVERKFKQQGQEIMQAIHA